jgi:hypothetical protein
MLVCCNCVVRLSPLLCKYISACSFSSLPTKAWFLSHAGVGNSTRPVLQSNILTGQYSRYSPRSHRLFALFLSSIAFTVSQSRSFRTSNKRDKKDYYDVLGIPKTANAKDVKKAYYTVRLVIVLCSGRKKPPLPSSSSWPNSTIRTPRRRKMPQPPRSFKKCPKPTK